VVGVKTFDFTKFRFRPWELYDKYDISDKIILVRASAYNLKFSIPSQSTFKLRINIPP